MFYIIVIIGVLQMKNNLKPLDDTVAETSLFYARFMTEELIFLGDLEKKGGSSWIGITITQARWFPSSSLGTDTTKLQLRVISYDDSNA
jgi:hypothetical protein